MFRSFGDDLEAANTLALRLRQKPHAGSIVGQLQIRGQRHNSTTVGALDCASEQVVACNAIIRVFRGIMLRKALFPLPNEILRKRFKLPDKRSSEGEG